MFMIKSMTGYGKAQAEYNNTIVSVEIKALNSKFLELNLRLPRAYAEKEIEIRNLLTQQLERGKVNVSVDIQSNDGTEAKVEYNKPLFLQYYRQLQELAVAAGAPSYDDIFRLALQQPEVTKSVGTELSEQEWQLVSGLIQEAANGCDAFRKREGAVLQERLLSYVAEIKRLLAAVEVQDPVRTETIKEKLSKKLEDLQNVEKVDQNRLEQELIYYIEKLDISEEKVRLLTHLNYLEQNLKGESNGKKLGFISQEVGREINTIGSKANDATIQRHVVGMKEELEKIKEQVLNIL